MEVVSGLKSELIFGIAANRAATEIFSISWFAVPTHTLAHTLVLVAVSRGTSLWYIDWRPRLRVLGSLSKVWRQKRIKNQQPAVVWTEV